MLNRQASISLRRREQFDYVCSGRFDLCLHVRMPTFTASFGKNDVGLETLSLGSAVFFDCIIEFLAVLVCKMWIVF